jgi:hypothetical protein
MLDPDTSYRPGYPIDLRPPKQIAHRARGPLGDFEWAAARVVARHSGARVTIQDDGSRAAIVDIRIDYADRDPGYVEVGTDIRKEDGATWNWVAGKGRLPQERPLPALRRDWDVTVSRGSFKALEQELEPLLLRLEAGGQTFEMARRLTSLEHPDATVTRLAELGVVMLSSRVRAVEPALARLFPDGIVGPRGPHWQAVSSWVARTLSSDELKGVRKKLAATNADERHFFLGVSYSSPGEVFFALAVDEQTLPSETPALPREITHLWLTNPMGDRCIAWFPDRGWFDVARSWATD